MDAVLGDIPLFLTPSTKSMEASPSRVAIGLIELGGWQIHRLEPVPSEQAGTASYLVRTHYEFTLDPEVVFAWVEVGFTFVDRADDTPVVDALPRHVSTPAAPEIYTLTPQLHFAQRNGESHGWPAGSPAATIGMPAINPHIDCFGIGKAFVKWRHTERVLPGSHTGCFVLTLPDGCEEIRVTAEGRYRIALDPDVRLYPASLDDAFLVRLPTAPSERSRTAVTAGRPRGNRGRVFISYAHETPDHKDAVRRLYELLRDQGLDVRYDQADQHERRNWETWTTRQIMRADFVLLIASPAYRQVAEDELPAGRNLGLRSEYRRLADLQHRAPDVWLKKILPVVLPGRSADEIPLTFAPWTADHYVVEDVTHEGAGDLLRVLLHEGPSS
ncbi:MULTISPECIES: toll/interleukin-1 receptor domain-containing protein [unclassified Streptomyces]|uniref:toll/interleukin-1 receptor domain-containing protein n=1 Tax=unclassified Streptomyces TaxID=2593676 RepID=UPI0033CB6AB4